VVEKLFPVELTRSEKDLLLNDLDLDPVVSGKMRLLAQRGNSIVVKLEREQVERMVNALEEAAANAICARSWSAPYHRPEAQPYCACPRRSCRRTAGHPLLPGREMRAE
jgi:hypothetical protein